MATKGFASDDGFKAVAAIGNADDEDVYFVINRNGTQYLERLAEYASSDDPDDYVMLDCAYKRSGTAVNSITAAHLANKTVDVLADGDHYKGLVANASGVISLPEGINCKKFVAGLPYETVMELPNIELQLRDGSMQGRRKKVSEAIMRLSQSLGGNIGVKESHVDHINFDEFGDQDVLLYSGDKRVPVPNLPIGGYEETGRVVITHEDPYPFSMSSIVRVVTLGG